MGSFNILLGVSLPTRIEAMIILKVNNFRRKKIYRVAGCPTVASKRTPLWELTKV